MRYGSYKVMRVGSCATGSREPSQVRKEAALSGPSRVPQGCLTRAEDEYDLMAPVSTAGARSLTSFARSLRAGIPGSRAFARWRVLDFAPLRSPPRAPGCVRSAAVVRMGRRSLRSQRAPAVTLALTIAWCWSAPPSSHAARPALLVAGARHERRRGEGARDRRAGGGAAQAAERQGHRRRAGREPERRRRPANCPTRPRSRATTTDDRERLPSRRGERLSGRLAWSGRSAAVVKHAARLVVSGINSGENIGTTIPAVGNGRRCAHRGPQRRSAPSL